MSSQEALKKKFLICYQVSPLNKGKRWSRNMRGWGFSLCRATKLVKYLLSDDRFGIRRWCFVVLGGIGIVIGGFYRWTKTHRPMITLRRSCSNNFSRFLIKHKCLARLKQTKIFKLKIWSSSYITIPALNPFYLSQHTIPFPPVIRTDKSEVQSALCITYYSVSDVGLIWELCGWEIKSWHRTMLFRSSLIPI